MADHRVRIWSLGTGELLRILEGHQDAVRNVAISPDEETFASSSKDGTILLRDVNTGSQLADYSKPKASDTSLAFSPLEPLIAFSEDKVIKL
jgi:WD40 repeat protein